MDTVRQVRWLIPPFFFLAALAAARWSTSSTVPGKDDLLVTIALSSVAILPLGFLITSLTMLIFRVLRRAGWNFDTSNDDGSFKRAWLHLGARKPLPATPSMDERHTVFASFDHGILYSQAMGVHEWLMRAYSGMVMSAYSVMALLLAHVGLFFPRTCPTRAWWLLVWLAIAFLVLSFFRARGELLRVLDFQTYRNFAKPKRGFRWPCARH